MKAGLHARLLRLEGGGRVGAAPSGVVVLPAGVSPSGAEADRLAAEHRERTGRRGTVVLLPDNGRNGD
jgi:hypothetical protein